MRKSMTRSIFRLLGCAAALAATQYCAGETVAIADDVVITAQARTRFAAGVALLQDPKEPRYEEAHREFSEAYRNSPSYRILGNLGLCAMKLERDEEAIWAYEKYLKEGAGDIAAPEREQIDRDLLTLRAGLVRITVATDPPGATLVGVRTPAQGSPIRTNYGPLLQEKRLGLRQGNYAMTAHLDGYEDARWTFDTVGSEMPRKIFKLEKIVVPVQSAAGVRERPISTPTFIAGGVTVMAAVTTTVLAIVALNQNAKYTTVNDGRTPAEAHDVRSRGQTFNVATDIALATTLLAGGATAYFFFTRPYYEGKTEKSAGIRVSPMWGAGGPAAAVSGSF